jgi:hypothetical protein
VQSDGNEDVYDLTVDEHHNFAIEGGVFVHNCDPVQGITGTFALSGGTVVDFPDYILPNAYFGPAPKGPYDRMGALKDAGDIAPEGYQIAAGITAEKDVFAHVVTGASMKPGVMARKKVPGSRTMQRLAQVAAVLGIKDPNQLGWV